MSKKNQQPPDGKKVVADNRRALRNYTVGERLEAGLVLTGTEVKSCREGKVILGDAYVMMHNGEAFLNNAHIPEYRGGNLYNHVPTRQRKLLLHGKEIEKLDSRIRERGETVIPLSLYFKEGRIKVEIGVAKGKTDIDRRDTIKDRESKREIQRILRHKNR
ncbi:MAG: SsrA-binding protein SmpB [Clostridia bacterium]|nr:SsrA-binding protein SmpB [Deltaproteobacteria bacterium]